MNKTLNITQEKAQEAYKNASEETKKLLVDLFGKDSLVQGNIMDRVKTLDDAIALVGITEEEKTFLDYKGTSDRIQAATSFMAATVITEALNEGWKADHADGDQDKYEIWWIYEEGVGLRYDGWTVTRTLTYVGARLSFKSIELAKYAANQFAEVFNKFLI